MKFTVSTKEKNLARELYLHDAETEDICSTPNNCTIKTKNLPENQGCSRLTIGKYNF